MQTLKSVRLTLFILLALSLGSFAGEIRKGATMPVKPDSIWFQDAAKLTRWQQLKKNRNSRALVSYQDKVLSNRDARSRRPLGDAPPAARQADRDEKYPAIRRGPWDRWRQFVD